MPIVYRSVKGANLTPSEVDGNFETIEDRLASLEGSGGLAGLSISNVTVSGNEVTFYREDGESWGPFSITAARFDWRGVWVAATAYYSNDVITNGNVTYLVLRSHTSAGTFDPDAMNGASQQLYAAMVTGVPTGGSTGQVLTKLSATDYDMAWIDGGGGGGSGSGGGGGGGLVPWAGAMLYLSTNQTNANGVEVALDTEETYSVEAGDYHNSGVTPYRLTAFDEGMYMVGFSVTLLNTDSGATYDAYITRNPAVGSPYAGDYPYAQGHDFGAGYVRIQSSQLMWLPAGLELSFYVNADTGNFDIGHNETRVWLYKIGSPPTSL